MSVVAHAPEAHGHGHEDSLVHHQFEDLDQQNECYTVGMWSFLVTEIMFFGALFLAYAVYRYMYPDVFAEASNRLDVTLGFINTLVLLTSSLFVALSIRYKQLQDKGKTLLFIGLTILCAFAFMGIKSKEYLHKWEVHEVPGQYFEWEGVHTHAASLTPEEMTKTAVPQTNADFSIFSQARETKATQDAHHAELYFGIYFTMTGLHGLHVIIGILILGTLFIMIKLDHPAVKDDYIPLELAGLYWHFVDIVWIFLFPLLYLIHPAAMHLFG